MKKTILILLTAIFTIFSVNAQTLSIDSLATEQNIPDSVNFNANLTHNIIVNITGGNPYTGLVSIVTGVDSTAGILSIDTVGTRFVTNKFNDTIMIPINETYNNFNGYRFGGNVVVIWPLAPTLSTDSSFQTTIYVTQSVGIHDNIELYNAISIYPNPSKDYIYINKTSRNINIKHVRINDANGRLIYNEKLQPKINISAFSKGIYFLTIELEQGAFLHYKLIKE